MLRTLIEARIELIHVDFSDSHRFVITGSLARRWSSAGSRTTMTSRVTG
jgi:hypothetical protein